METTKAESREKFEITKNLLIHFFSHVCYVFIVVTELILIVICNLDDMSSYVGCIGERHISASTHMFFQWFVHVNLEHGIKYLLMLITKFELQVNVWFLGAYVYVFEPLSKAASQIELYFYITFITSKDSLYF